MKSLRTTKWLAGLGLAAAVAAPALGLAQNSVTTTTTYGPTATAPDAYAPAVSTTSRTVTRSWQVNPNDPEQFPPASVGMNPDSHQGKVRAAYVDQQIALAKARGQDTAAAEAQEVMGQGALRRGLNAEASQHFDAALRSLGIMPNSPHSPEAGSYHAPMP